MAYIERFGGKRQVSSAAKLASPYQRGDFWLGKDTKSPNWILMRYSAEKKQTVKASTRTSDLDEAMKILDREYLSSIDQAVSFCSTCGQKVADGEKYTLIRCLKDYKIEHAMELSSYDTIRARLAHVIRYVYEEFDDDIPCSHAITDKFVNGFRVWMIAQPVEWRSKDGAVVLHDRTAATVEGSVRAMRAAMNHAVRMGRSDAKPVFRSKSAASVSMPVRTRAKIDDLARMVEYAQACPRRSSLLRFLVASICSGARPDALYDMNTSYDRFQWDHANETFDLNPFGREQTKKYRPTIPVLEPMKWLLESASEDGWVMHYYGRRTTTIRNPWRMMIAELGMGTEIKDEHRRGREYGTYLMRRSIATILRDRGATYWDLQGLLGHRVARTTETYATSTAFPTAISNLKSLICEIEDRLGTSLFDPNNLIHHPISQSMASQ